MYELCYTIQHNASRLLENMTDYNKHYSQNYKLCCTKLISCWKEKKSNISVIEDQTGAASVCIITEEMQRGCQHVSVTSKKGMLLRHLLV